MLGSFKREVGMPGPTYNAKCTRGHKSTTETYHVAHSGGNPKLLNMNVLYKTTPVLSSFHRVM